MDKYIRIIKLDFLMQFVSIYFISLKADIENKDTLENNLLNILACIWICVCVEKTYFQSINKPADIQNMQFSKNIRSKVNI